MGKYLRTVTYQEVRNEAASGELGRLCGRAARAEFFEGHARSGDLRAQLFLGDHYEWIDGGKAAGEYRPRQAVVGGVENGGGHGHANGTNGVNGKA